MNTIIEIVGISCLAFIFTTVVTPLTSLKFKPFTCESCMAFWIAIAYFYPTYGMQSILMASISYTIAGLIWKL